MSDIEVDRVIQIMDEMFRMNLRNMIHKEIESTDEDAERKRLMKKYKDVHNPKELAQNFIVHSFLAPFVIVTKKSTNSLGSMLFQHYPRLYFDFKD